jgi:integrase
MSSVEKRTRGGRQGWRVHYRDPDGQQRNRTFGKKTDAERFRTSVDSAKLTGAYVDPARGKTAVGDLATQYLAGKVNLKATTRARITNIVKVHVLPRWQNVPVSRVEHGDVQAWTASLMAASLSPASTRKAFGVLSGILDLAVRDKRIASNPAKGVNLPRVVKRSKRYLTAAQVAALAEAAGERGRLVVLTAAYTGLRWGELAGLRVKRVDLLRRRLTVAECMVEVDGGRVSWTTPKTYESRSVPPPEVPRRRAGRASGG